MVRPREGGAAAWCDSLLDGLVVLLATWTLTYHLCLVTRLGVTPAIVLEILLLAAAVVLLRQVRENGPTDPDPWPERRPTAERRARVAPRHLAAVAVVLAVVAAVAMALQAAFVLVWVPWAGSAVAASLWALGRVGSLPTPAPPARVGVLESNVALGWALGLGAFSWWVQNSNPDDVFYLNLSQEVASHGDFPVRDTLYSHLDFPMANWPPVASYDPLVGVIARLLHVHAASVAYLGVFPLATALSVLALWRLLRAWRVPCVGWALSIALVFLLVDGGESYATPGNLFVTRLWQGKVVLLCLLVPLLLVHSLRYVERPTRARLVRLALGSLAAVGMSTTAIFLVPVIAVGGMAPLMVRSARRAAAGVAALAAYPLGIGVVSIVIGGHSADDFGDRRLYRFDASWIGHEIFASGGLALVGVLGVLLGVLLVPHPAARLTSAVLALATGLVLIPGATRLSYGLTGLGPTLWRVSWVATIPALVAVVTVRAVAAVRGRLRASSRRWVTPVAAVTVLALAWNVGIPVWKAPSTGASLVSPFHWQRPPHTIVVAHRLLDVLHPGEQVLAPQPLGVTLAISTTDITNVAPRGYYLDYLRTDRTFDYPDRLALYNLVNNVTPTPPPDLSGALRRLHVDVVCMYAPTGPQRSALRSAGYGPLLKAAGYTCLAHG